MAVYVQSFVSVSPLCRDCGGKNYTDDQFRRQEVVREVYGTTPNDCVNSSDGRCLCKYKPSKK